MSEEKIKAIILGKIMKEIIYSAGGEVYRLGGVIEEEEKDRKYEEKRRKKKIKEEIKDREKDAKANEEGNEKEPELKDIVREKSLMKARPVKPLPKPRTPNIKDVPPQKRVLRIPAPRLPPRFSYLKPTPKKANIDIGKLNPLINDPAVRAIECLGPNTEIFVSGAMGRKKTNIVLSNDEINQIVDKFSEKTKIPVNEGVYRVVAGNLIFSAVISSVTNSRFIIRKMAPQKQPQR